VDTDAEVYAAIRCETGVRFGQGRLRYRILHRVQSTPKLRKDTIARRSLRDPCVPPMNLSRIARRSVNPFTAPELISTHEAAVALHVSHEHATSFRLTSTHACPNANLWGPSVGRGPTSAKRRAASVFTLRDGAEARPLRYPGDTHTLINTVAPGKQRRIIAR
jgi:hypothetical protein